MIFSEKTSVPVNNSSDYVEGTWKSNLHGTIIPGNFPLSEIDLQNQAFKMLKARFMEVNLSGDMSLLDQNHFNEHIPNAYSPEFASRLKQYSDEQYLSIYGKAE